MDEVNKSGPYYEAVSLCYFNGSDSIWRWTRVADIENGELTTFWYNPDEPHSYENRINLPDYTEKPCKKGELAVFLWSNSPNKNGSGSTYTRAVETDDFPIQIIKLNAAHQLQAVESLRNGVSAGSPVHSVMYTFGESTDRFYGILCDARCMEEKNQKYYLKDTVVKLPYYTVNASDVF